MADECRLLVLASKEPGLAPSQRFRLEQWAPRLKRDHGIELDLLPFESPQLSTILYKRGHFLSKSAWVAYDFARRLGAVAAARRYDAIVIHREAALIGPAIYERLLKRTGKPIIFDFDDAIWTPQPEQNSRVSRLRFYSKTATICRLSSVVSAGNRILADYARQYSSSVSIIPSTIELNDYPEIPEPADTDRFVVCWTGSGSTLVHFEQAREALEIVASRLPLTIRIICSEPPDRPIARAEMQFIRWDPKREAEDVGACHVGIMPLPDNEFSRGKCGMKALQYMATGRPVVVSPVGANTDIVHHNRNGFLAGTTDQFVDALMKLAASPQLRAKLGAAARQTVVSGYSAKIGAEKFASVVRSALVMTPEF
jgi:glycosyltransferase involved in cell wall biosynthesis